MGLSKARDSARNKWDLPSRFSRLSHVIKTKGPDMLHVVNRAYKKLGNAYLYVLGGLQAVTYTPSVGIPVANKPAYLGSKKALDE